MLWFYEVVVCKCYYISGVLNDFEFYLFILYLFNDIWIGRIVKIILF